MNTWHLKPVKNPVSKRFNVNTNLNGGIYNELNVNVWEKQNTDGILTEFDLQPVISYNWGRSQRLMAFNVILQVGCLLASLICFPESLLTNTVYSCITRRLSIWCTWALPHPIPYSTLGLMFAYPDYKMSNATMSKTDSISYRYFIRDIVTCLIVFV